MTVIKHPLEDMGHGPGILGFDKNPGSAYLGGNRRRCKSRVQGLFKVLGGGDIIRVWGLIGIWI
jgi:hypothetical protein